jgi:hypothetical protein
MAGKNVATKNEENEVALFGSARPDYVQDTGRGSEGVTSDDMSLPRLSIIQDLSPQRKKGKDEYIDGAEEGMIFNTASNVLYPAGKVILVPAFFRGEYVCWKDRDQGGGFGGAFAQEEAAEKWISEQEDPSAWDISYTHQHFCIMVHPDHTEAKPHLEDVVISMARSQLKPSRKWNTMVQNVGGDRFSRAYRLQAVQDKGPKGEFFNWKVEQLGWVPKEIFDRAEAMYEAVKAGTKDVSRVDEGRAERVDPNDM